MATSKTVDPRMTQIDADGKKVDHKAEGSASNVDRAGLN